MLQSIASSVAVFGRAEANSTFSVPAEADRAADEEAFFCQKPHVLPETNMADGVGSE
jgi:hypothetical protein